MKRTILLVDDDDAFMMLVDRALKKCDMDATLQYVGDGEQAVLYLSREGQFKDQTAFPSPSLVLLDLKMPRLDGFEVLQWRLERAELHATPFVILSSSDLERDKRRASELGARDFLTKPMDWPGLAELVKTLDRFWSAESK